MPEPFTYGLTIPHWGRYADRRLIIAGAKLAERYGFDSLWVRDHLVLEPHEGEGSATTFLDPFITLGLIAGATEKISLGTAAIIPLRHPLHTATMYASLEYLVGPGRVYAGMGLGRYDHEFVAVELDHARRGDILREQVEIIRALWRGEPVSHEGEFYRFRELRIDPAPADRIPIWFCGNAPGAVRRAVEYCDGWLPGRIPLKTYRTRVDQLRSQAAAAGRPSPLAGAGPLTSPARTREAALEKVDWQAVLRTARTTTWELPESGAWTTPEDLEGAIIAGPPDEIVRVTEEYQRAGLTHITYDLRFRFDDWTECVAVIGEEVLPLLRSNTGTAEEAAAPTKAS